ncbi:hypothetical protein V3C99_010219 [Haemonchus contortus]
MNSAVAVLLAVCFLLYITEGRHSHTHSHENGSERPPKPAFLKNLNDTLREEFRSIMKDRSLQPSEKRAKVLAWGEKYGLQKETQEHEDRVAAWWAARKGSTAAPA